MPKCKNCIHFRQVYEEPWDVCKETGYTTIINKDQDACGTFIKAKDTQIEMDKYFK